MAGFFSKKKDKKTEEVSLKQQLEAQTKKNQELELKQAASKETEENKFLSDIMKQNGATTEEIDKLMLEDSTMEEKQKKVLEAITEMSAGYKEDVKKALSNSSKGLGSLDTKTIETEDKENNMEAVKTINEAIEYVTENTELKGSELVNKAMELFPKVYEAHYTKRSR